MKRLRPALFLFVFVFLAAQNSTQGEVIRQPPTLEEGDRYRLAFVTSTKTTAESSDIEFYNEFVQAAANASPVGEWNLEWKAIASTTAVDARDNTVTHVGVDTNAPIYLVDGTLLAADYGVLWLDRNSLGSDKQFNVNEFGTRVLPLVENESFVWTGSVIPGVALDERGHGPLGSGERAWIGHLDDINSGWIDTGIWYGNHNELPLYALSELMTAVPEPSTDVLSFVLLTLIFIRTRQS